MAITPHPLTAAEFKALKGLRCPKCFGYRTLQNPEYSDDDSTTFYAVVKFECVACTKDVIFTYEVREID